VAALVRYLRSSGDAGDGGGRRLGAPAELVDALLLKEFPGRTLDELDSMDFARWSRAIAAQQILDVERVRVGWAAGKLGTEAVPAEVLEAIAHHDELLEFEDGAREHHMGKGKRTVSIELTAEDRASSVINKVKESVGTLDTVAGKVGTGLVRQAGAAGEFARLAAEPPI
jgi:hypothetical protein